MEIFNNFPNRLISATAKISLRVSQDIEKQFSLSERKKVKFK